MEYKNNPTNPGGQTEFCSLVSAALPEPQLGTAPVIHRLLLLEYAHPWGEDAWEEAVIDEEVKRYLEMQVQRQVFSRILLIRKSRGSAAGIHLFACNNREQDPFIRRRIFTDYRQLLDLDLAALFASSGDDCLGQPLFLVCTNGKTDKCCAKFGLPVYTALSELDPEVWQSSHVTGDRFAPNIVQLPHTHYYGRITCIELPDFYAAARQNLIYRPKYRGRSCYAPECQAAEYFLREATGIYGADELWLVREPEDRTVSEGRQDFGFYLPFRRRYFLVSVQVGLSATEHLLNCKQKRGRVKTFSLLGLRELSSSDWECLHSGG